MVIGQRLQTLRKLMQENNLDYYLVPSTDAHNSEYVPECWCRRAWISGFDGSMGEALIAHEQAYLSTDGRYFLQAEQQLDGDCYQLLKQKAFAPETEQWLKTYAAGKRLGVDPQLISSSRHDTLTQIMAEVGGELVLLTNNLVDAARIELGEQLRLPQQPAWVYDETYSGESTTGKLEWLREQLATNHAAGIVLNVLDEIAWLFNIRGGDVEFNPLVISYALITATDALLFVDEAKFSPADREKLALAGVMLKPYAAINDYIQQVSGILWLDGVTANYALYQAAITNNPVITKRSPIVQRKAQKNTSECQGMRLAHKKDAVAMIKFFYWLENNWQSGVDEIAASDKLAQFRAQQSNYQGLSFATISGFAANGAIIHYRATPKTAKVISDKSLYLLDSGGQYLEGTTDITRTMHLGTPTAEEKYHYTLVLKGHLALGRAKFSSGTCGEHLDILARGPLLNNYLNYRHGTGHGVGCFLCVHEGPQKISQANSNIPLVPGMVVSNEPGYYENGNYGIRIENLCLVQEDNSLAALDSDYGSFYHFESLTLVPYWNSLIDFSLLSKDDIGQLNSYYQEIRREILPLLDAPEQQWLERQLTFDN